MIIESSVINEQNKIIKIARNHKIQTAIESISYDGNGNFLLMFHNGYCLTSDIAKENKYGELDDACLKLFALKIYKNNRPNNYSLMLPQQIKAWLYLRMGLSLQILDKCVHYLTNRYIGSQEMIKIQVIKDTIARFITDFTSIELDLSVNEISIHEISTLHERLTLANKHLLKLSGAHGYIDDGIIATFYVSRLIENIYGGDNLC